MNYPPLQAIFFRDFASDHIPEILEEVYLKRVYDLYVLGRKNLIIVDGGQNIGLTSYYFKDFAKRIIGLEPSPMHRETCKTMLDYNKIKNVEILPFALSNKAEKKKLYLSSNSTAYSLTKLQENIPYEEIETIDIDGLFKLGKIEGKIDILKADFEGEEAKIFASDSFRNNMNKIPVILGEYHDWCGINQLQFMNMFREYGYQFNWNHNTKAATFSAVKI